MREGADSRSTSHSRGQRGAIGGERKDTRRTRAEVSNRASGGIGSKCPRSHSSVLDTDAGARLGAEATGPDSGGAAVRSWRGEEYYGYR